MGFSYWATAPLTSALTADFYGLKHLGMLNGVAFTGHQMGSALGIQLGGLLRDRTGSYAVPFAMAGLLLFAASLVSFGIQEKRYSARYQRALSPRCPTPVRWSCGNTRRSACAGRRSRRCRPSRMAVQEPSRRTGTSRRVDGTGEACLRRMRTLSVTPERRVWYKGETLRNGTCWSTPIEEDNHESCVPWTRRGDVGTWRLALPVMGAEDHVM